MANFVYLRKTQLIPAKNISVLMSLYVSNMEFREICKLLVFVVKKE